MPNERLQCAMYIVYAFCCDSSYEDFVELQ